MLLLRIVSLLSNIPLLLLIMFQRPNGTEINARLDKTKVAKVKTGDVVSFTYLNQLPVVFQKREDITWDQVIETYRNDSQRQLILNGTFFYFLFFN